jgi:hypothetical protein
MATWKKVVVSGSNVSQLNNDAGYLTAGTITQANGFATASVNGAILIADSATGSLTFASSSGQGLTLLGTSGPDTITFGLASIPNTSLANSGSIIGNTVVNLGTTVTSLTGLTNVSSTSFTGSLSGTASYASDSNLLDGLNSTAFVLNSQTSSMTVISASYAVSASHADLLDGLSAAAFVLNSQTSSMSVLSASFASSASNITNAITNNTDNRVLTATGTGIINGEANLTFDGTNLNLTGNQVISGDLTVNGTTTTINTQNLNVADRFILLSSGSTTANDGGIIIQSATGGTGFAFLYDAPQARWAFTGSLSATATTAAPDAFVSTVIDLNVAESTDKAIYQKNGNIKIETNGDIFIYS